MEDKPIREYVDENGNLVKVYPASKRGKVRWLGGKKYDFAKEMYKLAVEKNKIERRKAREASRKEAHEKFLDKTRPCDKITIQPNNVRDDKER